MTWTCLALCFFKKEIYAAPKTNQLHWFANHIFESIALFERTQQQIPVEAEIVGLEVTVAPISDVCAWRRDAQWPM